MIDPNDTKTMELSLEIVDHNNPGLVEWSETDNLTVFYKGRPVLQLNENLVEKQKLTDKQIEKIKDLHAIRFEIEEEMGSEEYVQSLKVLYMAWVVNQFLLQDAWGFPRNSDYHASHRLSRCLCPKMDNDDRLGTPHKVINPHCPLHGVQQ